MIGVDLAKVLVKIISHTELNGNTTSYFGIYNFSNEGKCSWSDFKKKFEINNLSINLQAIPTASYPKRAKRPSYSVLDKSKIKIVFGIAINEWAVSLKNNSNQ